MSRAICGQIAYHNLCQQGKGVPHIYNKNPNTKKEVPIRSNAVITNVPEAFRVLKEMNADHNQDESDYRAAGLLSLETILQRRMQKRLSFYLDEMVQLGKVDRRNR